MTLRLNNARTLAAPTTGIACWLRGSRISITATPMNSCLRWRRIACSDSIYKTNGIMLWPNRLPMTRPCRRWAEEPESRRRCAMGKAAAAARTEIHEGRAALRMSCRFANRRRRSKTPRMQKDDDIHDRADEQDAQQLQRQGNGIVGASVMAYAASCRFSPLSARSSSVAVSARPYSATKEPIRGPVVWPRRTS